MKAGGERRGQSSLRCSFKDELASRPVPAPPLGTKQLFERGAKPLPTTGSCLLVCCWNYLAAHNANAGRSHPFKPRRLTTINDHLGRLAGEGIYVESGGHWLELAVARGYNSRRGFDRIDLPCLKFAASRAQHSSAMPLDLKFQYRRIPLQAFSTRALTIEEFASCHAAIIRTCEFIPALRKVACDAVLVLSRQLP